MIRSNLLPKVRATVRVFGYAVDRAMLRVAGAGLLVAAVTALGATGIEQRRLDDLTIACDEAEARLAAQAPHRDAVQRAAFDLARLVATERRASELHRSGNDAALEIARLGDALGDRTSLDRLEDAPDGIHLRGHADTFDHLSAAIAGLAVAFPHRRPLLGDVDAAPVSGRSALEFAAVLTPAADPADLPVRPASETRTR